MSRYAFDNHIATENGIVHAYRNMTRTMPRQVNKPERTELHARICIREINWRGLVNSFTQTEHVQSVFTILVSQSGFIEERCETPSQPNQCSLMMRHILDIQFVASDLCLGDWS